MDASKLPPYLADAVATAEKATQGNWRVSMSGYSVKCDADGLIIAAPHGGAKVLGPALERWLLDSDHIASADPAFVIRVAETVAGMAAALESARWALTTDYTAAGGDEEAKRNSQMRTRRKLIDRLDAALAQHKERAK